MANIPEMPCYQSHKTVQACKIGRLNPVPGKPNHRLIIPTNPLLNPFEVDQDYVAKHRPYTGGYFVVYKDGYQSFSPTQAFEDGYTLCDPPLGSNPSSAEMNQTQTANSLCEGSDPDEESCTAETDPGGNPIDPTTIDPDGLQ